MSAPKHTPATARIQHRLEKLELEHLREHAAELAERLEAAEKRAAEAEERARYSESICDFWHDQAVDMQRAAAEESGGMPGLTMDGTLVIVPSPASGGLHA